MPGVGLCQLLVLTLRSLFQHRAILLPDTSTGAQDILRNKSFTTALNYFLDV